MLGQVDRGEANLIRYVEHFTNGGEAMLRSACRLSLEGIVSKKAGAAYVSGRTDTWAKSKCRAGHEVVGGWSTTNGKFRSLLVRQAAFKGLREDKPAEEVEADRPARAEDAELVEPAKASRRTARTPVMMDVIISKPDKPLWLDAGDERPVTKLDLAEYFEAVGPWMFKHLKPVFACASARWLCWRTVLPAPRNARHIQSVGTCESVRPR
jgi:hypothetical protein